MLVLAITRVELILKLSYTMEIGGGVMKFKICKSCNKSLEKAKIQIKTMQVLLNQKVIGYKYSYTWVDHIGVHHHCCTLEHNAIMEAMKIRTKGKIFEFGRWNEFKREVKFYLMYKYGDLFPKIDYYYSSYNISNFNLFVLYHYTTPVTI